MKAKCGETWFIAGGHCRATCGRCEMPAQSTADSQSAATGGQPSDCSDKGVPSNVSYGDCAQQKVRATPPSQLPAHACGRLPDLADP